MMPPANNVDNQHLMDDISADDILAALKRSCPKKSPGPDGLPKEFYQKTWHIISTEFSLVINEVLAGHFDRRFLNGVIVLVKKKGCYGTIGGFRPISLLNADYNKFSRI